MKDESLYRIAQEFNSMAEISDLVIEVYKSTKNFPKEELYGLTSQMRRSAIAIPSNIAEGYQRNHKRNMSNFFMLLKVQLLN